MDTYDFLSDPRTLTLAERVAFITYGKGTMPAQKGALNKAEITAVARYIDRFGD